jgi:hypothetical protein
VLTGVIEENYEQPTEESPTFGVVDDGRKYPAVTARRRQHGGSKRETLYTVSKNGQYAALYDQFTAEVIEPYRERKRKRTVGGGDIRVNTANTPESRIIKTRPESGDGRGTFGFAVNSVDRRPETERLEHDAQS